MAKLPDCQEAGVQEPKKAGIKEVIAVGSPKTSDVEMVRVQEVETTGLPGALRFE
jgi:hypothetical protein